jgi:hypothetical protein
MEFVIMATIKEVVSTMAMEAISYFSLNYSFFSHTDQLLFLAGET